MGLDWQQLSPGSSKHEWGDTIQLTLFDVNYPARLINLLTLFSLSLPMFMFPLRHFFSSSGLMVYGLLSGLLTCDPLGQLFLFSFAFSLNIVRYEHLERVGLFAAQFFFLPRAFPIEHSISSISISTISILMIERGTTLSLPFREPSQRYPSLFHIPCFSYLLLRMPIMLLMIFFFCLSFILYFFSSFMLHFYKITM